MGISDGLRLCDMSMYYVGHQVCSKSGFQVCCNNIAPLPHFNKMIYILVTLHDSFVFTEFYFFCVLMSEPKVKGQSDVMFMKVSVLTLYTITYAHISFIDGSK